MSIGNFLINHVIQNTNNMNRVAKIFIFSFFLLSGSVNSFCQFYSARTNILGLATGNLNVEFGMTLNKKYSIHIPVQYNPFIFSKSNNTKFQNLTVLPSVRYWFRESYRDPFVGFSLIASRYNIGNIWDKYRYDGWGVGAGFSFGWTYPMAPRWNFEWELGLAAFWANHDKSLCKTCGYNYVNEKKVYLVPHKIAVNLIYLF